MNYVTFLLLYDINSAPVSGLAWDRPISTGG
jgi:hypothetical protein